MHRHIFVAGTFDGLHKGHRFLLSEAFRKGEKVTIGLTSDLFVQKFKISNFPSERLGTGKFQIGGYEERKKALDRWLLGQNFIHRSAVIPIDNPYEPAASATGVDALVVTSQTRKRGEEINRKRKERGLKSLVLIDVPLVAAADGKPVSSTRMRNGEIDWHGSLVMPDRLRPLLQRPLGTVLRKSAIAASIQNSFGRVVITVGDITTKTFLDAGCVPDMAIIDGRVGRKPYHGFHEIISRLQPRRVSPFEANSVKSGPGFISREAMEAIRKFLTHSPIHPFTHNVLLIDGEEDLLVLPAVIYAPAGALVYYGQPPLRPAARDYEGQAGKGMVEVVVSESTKKKAIVFLRSFLLQAQ